MNRPVKVICPDDSFQTLPFFTAKLLLMNQHGYSIDLLNQAENFDLLGWLAYLAEPDNVR